MVVLVAKVVLAVLQVMLVIQVMLVNQVMLVTQAMLVALVLLVMVVAVVEMPKPEQPASRRTLIRPPGTPGLVVLKVIPIPMLVSQAISSVQEIKQVFKPPLGLVVILMVNKEGQVLSVLLLDPTLLAVNLRMIGHKVQ
jgi:hypothetical protein